ncbi:transcription repressor OFP14-like [Cornus florida]|uniref:transcription repressor OFP14-like n=1 Tax=Cornus florida TaxID=4283 RepID=UPI0028A18183|nr:transcription repressor OFP14-like [Cornus florida]
MPKQLQKSLQGYLSKIKKQPIPHINLPSKHLSSSASWILQKCKHPKTPSFSIDKKQTEDHRENDHGAATVSATLSDIDRFLHENFKSLYPKNDVDDEEEDGHGDEESGGFLFDSPRFIDPPPDLCHSHRFFVPSNSSRSLVEGTGTSTTMSEAMGSSSTTSSFPQNDATCDGADVNEVKGFDDFISVLTYSTSPCHDFRLSMQEMIEARLDQHGKVDWEFMEELLFCYFNLNHKKSHKYIISAFVDLVIVLRANSGELPVRLRQLRSTGERRKKREVATREI